MNDHRAAALTSTRKFEIVTRQFPSLQPSEAIVRVEYAGVCGTDIAIFSGDYTVPLPLVPGHELVGEVVEVGSEDSHPWIGKRVTAEINNSCRSYNREAFCAACRRGLSNHCVKRTVVGIVNYDGGYAEYVRVPILNLHPLPDTISWVEGVFIEPLAAAIQTFELTPISPSNHVVVLGIGRLGLLTCAVASLNKAQVCAVSRSSDKLERASKWGVVKAVSTDHPKWIEAVHEWTGGIGADVVVDTTGSPEGLRLAAEIVRPRGTIALKTTCGLPATGIDTTRLVVDEVQIHTSRCGPFAKAIGLLTRESLPVKSLVSDVLPLEDAPLAIEAAKLSTKILIQPKL